VTYFGCQWVSAKIVACLDSDPQLKTRTTKEIEKAWKRSRPRVPNPVFVDEFKIILFALEE
jgi:hypothetical protein